MTLDFDIGFNYLKPFLFFTAAKFFKNFGMLLRTVKLKLTINLEAS